MDPDRPVDPRHAARAWPQIQGTVAEYERMKIIDAGIGDTDQRTDRKEAE